MSKTVGIVSAVTCAVVIAFGAMAYALFNGYFDRGNFKVLSTQRSPSGQLAMVAKRSDHEALNGDEVFVLLGDHVLSTVELRHALHSPAVIFSTDRDCLSLRWKGADDLAISCEGNAIGRSEINRQLDNRDGVAFTYVNIANSK